MERLLFEATATAAATAAQGGTSIDSMNQLMAGFSILIGLFALYSAITGKGPAYKNDYPKVMQADAAKLMRIFCAIVGPVVTVFGVLDYLGYNWAFIVNASVTLPAIIVYTIIFRRKFKQYLK